MSGHPLHGTKPLSDKIRTAAHWGGGGNELRLWKLQRCRDDGTIEIHPTAGGLQPVWASTEGAARERAADFPGWELTLA
jgi:hypothetical protein